MTYDVFGGTLNLAVSIYLHPICIRDRVCMSECGNIDIFE